MHEAIAVLSSVLLAACASTPGARPHEMSAAGHEEAARQHEQIAWTSNREVESHLKMAQDHRAASQALRDAEATACAGIPEADRDVSPFEHREDIASVEPIETRASEKPMVTHTEGALITFRAVPGMTAQWLQRVVDCHLARNAALGHVVPEMPSCPLVPSGVTAKVTPTPSGFAVAVTSDDGATVQEILRRARSLVAR